MQQGLLGKSRSNRFAAEDGVQQACVYVDKCSSALSTGHERRNTPFAITVEHSKALTLAFSIPHLTLLV
jgi:hypothetical protein